MLGVPGSAYLFSVLELWVSVLSVVHAFVLSYLGYLIVDCIVTILFGVYLVLWLF
jgi:hypothetical protein